MSARRSLAAIAGLFALPLLFGCNQQTVEVQLHALQASGKVAFVCRQTSGSEAGKGIDRSQCPDYDDNGYKFFALVTQMSTEEVAVIDTQDGVVVDLDPATPGYSFLRVPSRPGDIVATPGGAATFVGLTGVGKEGITGIPTTCITAPNPDEGETARDVTSFPSCHLPTMPGDMAVVIAPPEADGTIRESCDPSSDAQDENPTGARRKECSADLTKEHVDRDGNVVGPVGRRKLAVALPRFGEVVIVDAQWLLDQVPGSFPECRIEATLPLSVERGPVPPEQKPPPELVTPPGCVIEYPPQPPPPASFSSRPGGFGLAGDVLYVADRTAPVVHVLDMSNPCAPSELPPLLPKSFEKPNRIVTTSRVAATPLTSDGKRYVYAIDEFDIPASLMAFDVSTGSTDRTPIVRPGGLLIPEPADRLRLGVPVEDIAFALRDLESTDPETGVAESGVKCDPDPAADASSAGALHRPTSDKSHGAQPRLLRGLFGLAMLKSGHVAIIDIDDFDAPCRRPVATNASEQADYRGCFGDGALPPYLTVNPNGAQEGAPTVTNEASCNMVERHRFRSATFGKTNTTDGTGYATLVAFPEFAQEAESVDLPPQNQPKLLAVPFDATTPGEVPPEPQVYIGTTLHQKSSTTAELPTDPNTAVLATLTLPFTEPRAHPPGENVNLTYEGAITKEFPSGNIVLDARGMRIEDAAAQFCDLGVYDHEMLGKLGVGELGVEDSDEARALFAESHADVVEVTNTLLPVTDSYWSSPILLGSDESTPPFPDGCGLSRSVCVDTFGTEYDALDVNVNRELVISEAYQDQLRVSPRNAAFDEDPSVLEKRLKCCFPQGLKYRIHLQKQWILVGGQAGLDNDVTARKVTEDADGVPFPNGEVHYRCDRDCDPRKKYMNGRVFEVASSVNCLNVPGTPACAVGLAEPGDACVYNPCFETAGQTVGLACDRVDGSLRLPGSVDAAGNPQPADTGALSCIHAGPTARFVVYRGLSPSLRGMTFSWQTTGGFRALLSSLAAVSIAVSPTHIEYVPELQRIAIVDGAQLGLSLVSLDTLRVEDPWPVY